ncbi:MAG: hypothetical protein IJE16_03005 [Ruminococcus sp.]|nr:hypothetical protein [Ruminococcus sp.]
MLVLAVFITSIPLATWTAIASTIMAVQLGAEDSSEVSNFTALEQRCYC